MKYIAEIIAWSITAILSILLYKTFYIGIYGIAYIIPSFIVGMLIGMNFVDDTEEEEWNE